MTVVIKGRSAISKFVSVLAFVFLLFVSFLRVYLVGGLSVRLVLSDISFACMYLNFGCLHIPTLHVSWRTTFVCVVAIDC